MSYATIDPAIHAWVTGHSLSLCTTFADREARFIYVSSNIGECFQISISAPQDGHIVIGAYDVETHQDEILEASITVPMASFPEGLEDMLKMVYGWMKRHDASATRHIPQKSL